MYTIFVIYLYIYIFISLRSYDIADFSNKNKCFSEYCMYTSQEWQNTHNSHDKRLGIQCFTWPSMKSRHMSWMFITNVVFGSTVMNSVQ